jgi:hypothetical protein
VTALVAIAAVPVASAVTTSGTTTGAPAYDQRFLSLDKKLHDPENGYFSKTGIPYHSIETLMVEAPDHGHATTVGGVQLPDVGRGRVRPDHRRLDRVQQRLGVDREVHHPLVR